LKWHTIIKNGWLTNDLCQILSKGLIGRNIFKKYVGLCTLSSEVGNVALKQTALSLFAKRNRGTTAIEKKIILSFVLFCHIKRY